MPPKKAKYGAQNVSVLVVNLLNNAQLRKAQKKHSFNSHLCHFGIWAHTARHFTMFTVLSALDLLPICSKGSNV